MAQKPSIPKGTRDFSPAEVAKRNYIIQTIKKHFETYGFQPIETPSFENSDTLMGKYGDEGDRLIFKILDSGDYFGSIAGEIERSFLLINACRKTLESLTKTIVDKLAMPDGQLRIELYQEKEIEFTQFRTKYGINLEKYNQLISELNDPFEYHLKRNLSFFKRGLGNKEYVTEILNNLNVSKIIEKYLNFLRTVSFNIEAKKIIKYIKEDSSFHTSMMSFSKEMLQNVLDKNLSLINPVSNNITRELSGKALRYDLTVPFARYVVMHQNEIDFPFKRYQIQPVWRADRPQKGRFREFYQCDADVVGANSLLQEVEFVQLYDAVFTDLQLKGTTIKINNRKILSGIAEVIGAKHLLVDFTVALDKLDKIGEEKVKAEMQEKGISESAIKKAQPLFSMTGTASEQLEQLRILLADSEVGMAGVGELDEIISAVDMLGLQSAQLQLDVTLARGLNYYTGAIFEVAAPEEVKMGSIGGGGRYDDLTGIFGLKDVSGVGISFGLDRIYLVLEELNLFPESLDTSLDVLCLNFGEKEGLEALKLVASMRKAGLRADLYPTAAKMQKQFKYADKRGVPYVVLLGEEELKTRAFVVKEMKSGQHKTYALDTAAVFAEDIS